MPTYVIRITQAPRKGEVQWAWVAESELHRDVPVLAEDVAWSAAECLQQVADALGLPVDVTAREV